MLSVLTKNLFISASYGWGKFRSSYFCSFKVSREERRIDIKYEMGGEKLLGREYQTILSVSDISVEGETA